mmetsp:Transcript_15193/g.20896  ORF Transcript_15193/g.20896 Transcript_15193/m.20896 type:complete len:115 (+) Transcript_15193:44-388(+)
MFYMMMLSITIFYAIVSVSVAFRPPARLRSGAMKMTTRTEGNELDERRFVLEEVTVLSDLSPANYYYESQILSALKNWKGERLLSYLLPSEGNYSILQQMREQFNEVEKTTSRQ